MRTLGLAVVGVLAHLGVVHGLLVALGLPTTGYGAADRPAIALVTVPLALALAAAGPALLRLVARAPRLAHLAPAGVSALASFAWSVVVLYFTGAWAFGLDAPLFLLWTLGGAIQLALVRRFARRPGPSAAPVADGPARR